MMCPHFVPGGMPCRMCKDPAARPFIAKERAGLARLRWLVLSAKRNGAILRAFGSWDEAVSFVIDRARHS